MIINRVLLILTPSGSVPVIDVYVHWWTVEVREKHLPVLPRPPVHPVQRGIAPVSPVDPVLVDGHTKGVWHISVWC